MFGLMKNVMKENPIPADAVKLADMHAGCVIGFGYMQQKNLSGKRIGVSEVNSYLFEPDAFIAYRLENDSTDISLIVADEEDPSGTYLALSQRIDAQLFESLFEENMPQYWFALSEGEEIEVASPALGAHQGWFSRHYTLAVSTNGRYLEGDYRLRKVADRKRLSRPFEYVLLVDEDNEYALEAEKYEDGTFNVFATLYRPATDIGEISRGSRPGLAASAPQLFKASPAADEPQADAKDAAKPDAESSNPETSFTKVLESVSDKNAAEPAKAGAGIAMATPELKPAPEVIAASAAPDITLVVPEAAKPVEVESNSLAAAQPAIAETAIAQDTKAVTATAPMETIAPVQVPTAPVIPAISVNAEAKPVLVSSLASALAAPVKEEQGVPEPSLAANDSMPAVSLYSKFGRIQPASSLEQREAVAGTLACDLNLAGRLICEAQRNQMLLSEVIRKVIDLPTRVNDQVLIPFSLDDTESAELARRYNLPASDKEAIKERILEDLKRFVGDKK